ncbi:putative Tyrosyl-DNA phosphodiesterase-domain-containing protein [Seiridium cardinale]|uniref:Tyrosyl-DNA phosphodiesterase-domain-containing protein n=1 Tax=Seiridium cardinale TaxID=138064 RepID=A0ABR2XFR2_9PEZI
MAGSAYGSDEDADLKLAIALSLASTQEGQAGSDEPGSDEDLKRAIVLSLSQNGSDTVADVSKSSPDQGEEDEDEDEDDLNKTPVYRPRKQEKSGPRAATPRDPSQQTSHHQTESSQAPSTGPLGLNGSDRKRMEEERLARLAIKRKASDSDLEPQDRSRKLRTGPASQSSRSASDTAINREGRPSSSTKVSGSRTLPFPKGVIKKTFAQGFQRTEDDIKIEEVFQKDKLQLAVLSSFQWDEEWMMSKIDFQKTSVYLIAFANSKEQQEEMRANVLGGAIKFCFPPMSPMGSMHSKLQLLKFADYLRIVVPTGNLVPYDWGETGVMENMVFMMDLPLIEDPARRAANELTPFGQELAFFLSAQGLEQSLVKSLGKYDFSETSRYALVHTIGTPHAGDDWKRTGYCGLGRAVSTLGLGSSEDIELDYLVSSLGSVNHDLITAIYYAARGDDGLKEYRERTARGKRAKAVSAEAALGKINDHFRIYFPSRDTVDQSRAGRQSAGTICVQSKWWNSDTFPRQLVRESESERPGLLMHSKLMLVRSKHAGKDPVAWAYVGSANLSESAWGRLTKDKQTGNPKLTCRNWECGVLVSVTDVKDNSDSRTSADEMPLANDMSVFLGSIPVPIIWPSEAYGRTGAKQPWLFLDSH